jgi:thioredoxin reductase (NADPH)
MPRHDIIIVGGGIAGLSAAIYLGRALRDAVIIDDSQSLARWEPDVQNYLGFPEGISGCELLERGRQQAQRFEVPTLPDSITNIGQDAGVFKLRGKKNTYDCERLLLATGIYHLPPEITAVDECLGHSMFFCKDCDGHRVQDKSVLIFGSNNEAVEYALGLTIYSPTVAIVTHGGKPHWDKQHAGWIAEYEIPVYSSRIVDVKHEKGYLKSLAFEDGTAVKADFLFTTRGDLFHNELAMQLGAELDTEGQIKVDACQRTSIPKLYAAGCVTPANCQMIIAAGEGARAAQAINRDMFEESLANHKLRRYRQKQIKTESTVPEVTTNGAA